MELGDWDTITSIIANSVTALTAVVLVVVAIKGLQAWRQQMVGQSRYEAARRLLLLARRFRSAFGRSRGAATWSDKYTGRLSSKDETPEQAHILDEKYARLNRLRSAADLLVELEQATWEAEIVTGVELVSTVRPFGEVVRELNIAILQHFELQLQQANRPPMSTSLPEPGGDFFSRLELIYQPGEDELTRKVDEALANLEKRLKKYIR